MPIWQMNDRVTRRVASSKRDLLQVRKDDGNGERFRLEQSLLHILGVLQEYHECIVLDDYFTEGITHHCH
jgi:hypothetical protein